MLLHFPLTFSHQAIGRGDKSAVEEWLQENGTKVNECKGGKAFPGHNAVANGTALHWAANYGQLEIAKLLFDHGAGIYLHTTYNLVIKTFVGNKPNIHVVLPKQIMV